MTRRRTSFAIRCWQLAGTVLAVVMVGFAIEGAARAVEWVAGAR